MEFDVPRYWPGRRIGDLLTGDMTWREFRTFVRHLPPDSAYVRAVRTRRGDNPDWTPAHEIARIAANALIAANYQRIGKRTPDSALIPEQGGPRRRPGGDRNGHKQELSQAEFDALFRG